MPIILAGAEPPAPPPAAGALGVGSYNGLAFGTGTNYHVHALEGLWDLPEIRTNDLPRATGVGYFGGRDRKGGRTVILTLTLLAATPGAYETLAANLRSATEVQTVDLPLRLMNNTVYVKARPRRRILPIICDRPQRYSDAVVEFFCADSNVYSGAP